MTLIVDSCNAVLKDGSKTRICTREIHHENGHHDDSVDPPFSWAEPRSVQAS